jgi:hypothetical protein
MRDSDAPCPRTAVLLGASNLAMGLPRVLEVLRRQQPGPIRVFAARGYGRSYGTRSRVLLRELPGIVECGLWSAIAEGTTGHAPDALITDVGNDLVYGATPDGLIGWVEACLDRLERTGARVTITGLPVASVHGLSRARFAVMRRLLFPSHPLPFERMRELVSGTDRRLTELARDRGATAVPMDPAWYGLDPVHFSLSRRRQAWATILASWSQGPPAEGAAALEKRSRRDRHVPRSRSALEKALEKGQARFGPRSGPSSGPRFRDARRARPARWWFAGRERSSPQPALRLADGSELWLF